VQHHATRPDIARLHRASHTTKGRFTPQTLEIVQPIQSTRLRGESRVEQGT
jgi:hypothetical protein